MVGENVREVTETVAARESPPEEEPSSTSTPEGVMPCLRRVTPVNVV